MEKMPRQMSFPPKQLLGGARRPQIRPPTRPISPRASALIPLLSIRQDNQTMDHEQKSQIDSVKAARRYSRALQERKRCDERKAKSVGLIAAVLLCLLMT